MHQRRSDCNDEKGGNFLASIDAELQRTRVSCLEQENANIEREKQDLVASVEEADAKARALKSEVVKLRNQLQQSQQKTQQLQQQLQKRESVTANQLDGDTKAKAEKKWKEEETQWKIEKATLEHKNNELKSENDRLKAQVEEVRDVVPSANELSINYKNLKAENDTILENQRSLQESLRTVTERNAQLYEATRNLETQGVTLRKTNQELKASLTRHEEENKTLISKNYDLADENAKLEKEGYKLQKEKISLEAANETLAESKTALGSEIQALQAKLNGTRNPDDDERYRQDLNARNDRLREEKSKMGDELRRMENELRHMDKDLRQREDSIADMRRDDRVMRGERADLLREIRDLNATKNSALDENNDLKKKCAQLQKDVQKFQAQLTAAQHTPRTEKTAGDKNLNPKSSQSATTEGTITSLPDPPNEPLKGPRASAANEPPRGPKRKTFDSPRPQPNHDPRFVRPTTPDNNPEKRQRLDQPPPPPPPVTTFKRKGAIYLVELPQPINYSVLRAALVGKLGSEIEGLRRAFYGPTSHKEQWAVKFTGAPKEFVKHVYVTPGIFATLIAGSGTTCLICSDENHKHHNIWECPYLGQEGQDRPTLKQMEMNYRPPPLGAMIDAMPPNPPTPVSEQSPRSLFERVSFPDGRQPPRRALANQGNSSQTLSILSADNIRSRETHLLNLSRTERRALFCRFIGSYVPKEDQLISIVNVGPIEWVKISPNSQVGFVDFVYPDHAEWFLKHAIANINGKCKFYDPSPGSSGYSTVVFQWSDTAVKPLEPLLAKGIVTEGWTRVLTLEQVPKGLTVDRISSHAEGDGTKLGFWVSEDAPYPGSDGTRDVKIEFRSIKEAEKAYRSFVSEGYPQSGLSFSPEEIMRQAAM